MNSKNLYDHPGWKWCTSEGAEMDSLLMGFQMSLIEKLEWLEEMENLKLQSVSNQSLKNIATTKSSRNHSRK